MSTNGDRELRLAVPADREQIIALDRNTIGSSARRAMIAEAIEDGQCYVITVEERAVAYGILNYHFFGHGFIEVLVVDQQFRRQGIGRMLLLALSGVCRTEKLFTSTNASNQPMQRLLDASGFKRSGWIDQLDPGDPELVYCLLLPGKGKMLDA